MPLRPICSSDGYGAGDMAQTLKVIAVFIGLAAVIGGLTMLLSSDNSLDHIYGGALLAGGLTYFWQRTGLRGLK
jgi:hypothetical protein